MKTKSTDEESYVDPIWGSGLVFRFASLRDIHGIRGTIYYVVGRSGAKTYPNTKKAWDTFFYIPLDQPNYLVVEGLKITIKVVKKDDTLIDAFSIDKVGEFR